MRIATLLCASPVSRVAPSPRPARDTTRRRDMHKTRSRSYLDDGLYVLLIMAAAAASAALEAGAVLGAVAKPPPQSMANAGAASRSAAASAPKEGTAFVAFRLARLTR